MLCNCIYATACNAHPWPRTYTNTTLWRMVWLLTMTRSVIIMTVDMLTGTTALPDDCVDKPSYANCELILEANMCRHPYFRVFCCRSCHLAGRLPWTDWPLTINDDQSMTNSVDFTFVLYVSRWFCSQDVEMFEGTQSASYTCNRELRSIQCCNSQVQPAAVYIAPCCYVATYMYVVNRLLIMATWRIFCDVLSELINYLSPHRIKSFFWVLQSWSYQNHRPNYTQKGLYQTGFGCKELLGTYHQSVHMTVTDCST